VYHDDSPEPSLAVLKASLREHERLVAAIERGDSKVGDVMAQHLVATQASMSAAITPRTSRRPPCAELLGDPLMSYGRTLDRCPGVLAFELAPLRRWS